MSTETVIPMVDPFNNYNVLTDDALTSPIDNLSPIINMALDKYLINHAISVFFVNSTDDAMANQGIYTGDRVMVDKMIQPAHGSIVVVTYDEMLLIRRLHIVEGKKTLEADNPEFSPIIFDEKQNLMIWGVVTHVMHTVA